MILGLIGRIFSSLSFRVRRALYSPSGWIHCQVLESDIDLIHLGTKYGGWTVLANAGLNGKYAILCGAGEDISFDLALQKRFGCEVLIVDPTPRAIAHFEELRAAQSNRLDFPIGDEKDQFYEESPSAFEHIKFSPAAVWHVAGTLKFWKPKNDLHVSHSAVNLQETNEYIEVAGKTLREIAEEVEIDLNDVSLLKLDIEGAECSVIGWCVANDFLPEQLLVEFDELNFPEKRSAQKIKETIFQLLEFYRIVHFDGRSNCLFVRRN